MKHLVSLILTLIIFGSCVTPSKTFLANKHGVNTKEISIIKEGKSKFDYSPFFELRTLTDYTDWYITNQNFDSVARAYREIKQNTNKKTNCLAYEVSYKLNKDTFYQKIYLIETKNYQITHDNDIINRMSSEIEHNFTRFIKIQKNTIKSIYNNN